jgi:hypothetical protein
MREIEVYYITDANGDNVGEGTCNTNLVTQLLHTPTEGGADYDEIKKIAPIIEKFNKATAGTSILLEESEFIEVRERVSKGPYNFISIEIFDIIDKIINAKEVEVTKS